MSGRSALQPEAIALRSLSPVYISSRSSSTRSASLRRSKAQADGGVPASPRTCPPGDPPPHFARPRKQGTQKKVPDEWKTSFATWIDVAAGPPDEMVVSMFRQYGIDFSLQQFLSLSRPRPLSKLQHDEQLSLVQDFVGDTCESFSVNFTPPAQQPKAWLDHQLWLDDEAGGMTIPDRQPKRILSNADLDYELRPIIDPILAFKGHVKSIYRRLLYVADGDPSSVLAMIRQATTTQAWALGELLRGHFDPEPDFSLKVDVISEASAAAFVFHMPYLALAREKKLDTRMINGRRLRETYDLSCLRALGLRGNVSSTSHGPYMMEAVMSVTVNVRDDRWWEVCCLNDELPFEESRLEEDGGDDTKVPELTIGTPESQSFGIATGASSSRRKSYPGLEPTILDQCDPVLNIPNSYSYSSPRVYALKFLEKQLEQIVQCQEAIFALMKKDCRAYKKSGLVNADKSQKYKTTLSADEIKEAFKYTLGYMRKLLDTVKQQHEQSQDFLYTYLGIDKSKPPSSWVFRDSLFVGLNHKKDLKGMEKCIGIFHSIERLHSLRHAIELEIEGVKQLKEEHQEQVAEQQRTAKKNSHAWSVRLGVLLYVSQALMIPLALYNIPNSTTRLPNDSKGLAGVTLGLAAAFLVAPLILWGVCRYMPLLQQYIVRRWFDPPETLSPAFKRD